MIAVAMPPRASADVAAELAQRKTRQAELEERRALLAADLRTKRAARARAVAEGSKKGPTASEISTLAEEADGITAALTLLAEDAATLEAEAATSALVEAERVQGDAVAEAMEKIAALDAALRRAVASIVAPASDAFAAALTAARRADDALDSLRRKASTAPLLEVRGKAERVIDRRSALLALIADVRRYVEAADATYAALEAGLLARPVDGAS